MKGKTMDTEFFVAFLPIYLVLGILMVGIVVGSSDILDRFPRWLKIIIRLILVALWMPVSLGILVVAAVYVTIEYIFGK